MGFLWFLFGFLTAVTMGVGAMAMFSAGMAAEKKKSKLDEPDVDAELYNDSEVR